MTRGTDPTAWRDGHGHRTSDQGPGLYVSWLKRQASRAMVNWTERAGERQADQADQHQADQADQAKKIPAQRRGKVLFPKAQSGERYFTPTSRAAAVSFKTKLQSSTGAQ